MIEYVTLLEQVKQKTDGIIPLEIDVPAFYHKFNAGLLKKIINCADTITIMAYERRTPAKILAVIDNLARRIAESGKSVVIGLNSKDFENRAELDTLIEQVSEMGKPLTKFAIHDYHDFKELVEK